MRVTLPGEVVEAAVDAGVTRMIAMGVDVETSRNAFALAHRFPPVWAGVGHHPTDPFTPDMDALRTLALQERVVAVGEVGLDFEEAGSPPPEVSIHNRSAATELVAAIAGHPGLQGVMHYFALDWNWAERFLELGFYISFAGLVTRPSRHELREVAKRCPAHRLLLETDSPYGNAQKRMGVQNRPAYLIDTAELVAEQRGVSLDELGAQETANALALFRRMR